MATVSPTPMGQGSHFTSLGRRTSARQALRRPPSRSQMAPAGNGSKRSSMVAAAHDAQQQQYSTMHDSSDDEMPIPMKLSALTKALLSDGASSATSEDAPANVAAAAAAAAAASSSGRTIATRRRSALTRSSSSAALAADHEQQPPPPQQQQPQAQPLSSTRQTRRSVRAGSVQPGSAAPSSSSKPASRTASPLQLRSHENSSPAPRKRVVRLSSATPAGSMGSQPPPPLRRSMSASKHAGGRRTVSTSNAFDRATAAGADEPLARASSAQPADLASSNTSSAALAAATSAASSSAEAAAAAAAGPSSAQPSTSFLAANSVNTPGAGVRRVQIAVGSSGKRSSRARLSASSSSAMLPSSRRTESAHQSDAEEAPATAGRPTQVGSASRYGSSGGSGGSGGMLGRSHDVDQQHPQQALPGSMRIKRVGKSLGGGFLSGPARRGRRRTSDEDGVDGNASPGEMLVSSQESQDGGRRHDADGENAALGASSVGGGASFYEPYTRDYPPAATGSPVSAKDTMAQRATSLRSHASKSDLLHHQSQSPANERHLQEHAPERAHRRSPRMAQDNQAQKAAPAAPPLSASRPTMPSTHDQENEIPYVVHLPKPLVVSSTDLDRDRHARSAAAALRAADAKPVPMAPVAEPVLPPVPSSAVVSSPADRKVLGSISRNTPRRAAPPPPPKMTVLETATAATAGVAGTAQANKKPRILLKVNGRAYQRVDCIGRGGSAKVYKVTAENGKMFAMKRVSLESADESTVRGCLGEIDLLKRLSGVDRVIQLYDCEMNKEKQMLSLLMELGEMDLYSLIRVRQNLEQAGPHLDPVFIRFYWKEMVECVQAVHAADIVHSDLKPANFVLVQGRLKLIDFGIANAIQTDETVNVHRENQVGTPNYMSPESLMDSQQYAFTSNSASRPGAGGYPGGNKGLRVVKLGKPSDVWSLGCILYQMVYGLPPFGHIQNQMARYQAIITWSHVIHFPSRGLGGVLVPAGLMSIMRRCLNRDQHLRPTCAELLSPTDPFLYPEAMAAQFPPDSMPITEELLGRIIQSVVTRCKERMPTDAEAMSAWPGAYWASVRRAVVAKDDK